MPGREGPVLRPVRPAEPGRERLGRVQVGNRVGNRVDNRVGGGEGPERGAHIMPGALMRLPSVKRL